MEIISTREFEKSLKKLDHSSKNKVLDKIEIFSKDWQDPRLKTHRLKGKLKDKWAFRVTYSIRVIFILKEEKVILLLDVGEHSNIY